MYDLDKMDKRHLSFGHIFLLANRLQTVMDQSSQDLTAKQWLVLMTLGMFNEPPTLKQLAAMCDSSHQNIKQLVLKLQEKGFVQIEADPADRRALRISATSKCQQWETDHKQFTEQFISTLFEDLTGDEIQILSTAQLKLYNTLGVMKTQNKAHSKG